MSSRSGRPIKLDAFRFARYHADMQYLKYTQKHGFEPCTIEKELGARLQGGDDLERSLKEAGFEALTSDGTEDSVRLDIYQRVKETREFVALFDDEAAYEIIYVPDPASLMALRVAVAPVIAAGLLRGVESMDSMVSKAFRVLHRHDPTMACDECDPTQARYERDAERVRQTERLRKRAEEMLEEQKKDHT